MFYIGISAELNALALYIYICYVFVLFSRPSTSSEVKPPLSSTNPLMVTQDIVSSHKNDRHQSGESIAKYFHYSLFNFVIVYLDTLKGLVLGIVVL